MVGVRAEILPRDFVQTPGNNYLSLTMAKDQFLRALTVKLSIFRNEKTSYLEILTILQMLRLTATERHRMKK